MQTMIDAVQVFMEDKGIPVRGRVPSDKNVHLRDNAKIVRDAAQRLETDRKRFPDDSRFTRYQGITEETAELGEALANGDEVAVLDALCDLVYFALGTAVAFDLPLEEALGEVHMSNMTKSRDPVDSGAEDRSKDRLRTKGTEYQEPDLKGVLARYRQGRGLRGQQSLASLKTTHHRWMEQLREARRELDRRRAELAVEASTTGGDK